MESIIYTAGKKTLVSLSLVFFIFNCFTSQLLYSQVVTFEGKKLSIKSELLTSSFKDYEVFELDAKAIHKALEGQSGLKFVLKMGDKHVWPISLSRHDITSQDYQELTTDTKGNLIVLPRRSVDTYRGYVTPKIDSNGNVIKVNEDEVSKLPEVRMSIREDYIIGYVTVGDKIMFIEPLNYSLKSAPNHHYLVYDSDDVLQDPELTCGVLDIKNKVPHQHDHSFPNIRGKAMASQCVEVRLLLASTFDMVTKFGTVAAVNDHMQDITNLMAPFYNFAGLNYVISQQFTPGSLAGDPFTNSALAEDLLASIETWASGGGILPHGIGQLWTARDIFGCGGAGTGLVGCAWIGAVCASFRYNINEDFTPNISCLARLSAHELGHNWDCEHSDADNSNNIMWPSISCSATGGFSANSMGKINAHISSRGCLDACSVPGNDLCGGATSLSCGDTFTGSIFVATDSDVPPGCSGGGLPNEGVWFTFTGNGQIATISTAGSSFDTQINIYSGSCGSLSCIGGDDDGDGSNLTSSFTFCTVNGVQYFVYVDGFGGETGNYTINLNCVNDNVPPVITCPANVNVGNDPGACGAIVTYAAATATDNCGVQSITYSQNSNTFFPVGTTPVTATATDLTGNSASCNFNVTVTDLEAPSIDCSGITTSRNTDPGVCTYTAQGIEFDATGTDNCPGSTFSNSLNNSSTLDGYVFPVGGTSVTWTMEDAVGNSASCNVTITVTDMEPPTINCFDGSVTFNGEEEFILDVDDYTTYDDNCGIQSVDFDIPVITCEDLGDIFVITATATDIYGNTANCNFNLEVLGLPCGWSFTPDGINCSNGNDVSYSVPLDEFYVESTNCFFGHPFNSDAMAFAQYELCGNGTITAHVTDISGNALGWAGVSMRESNAGGSKKVQLLTNRSNLSRREVRLATNGNSFPQQFMSFNRYWLRLTRNGNQFTGHVSPNGVNWYFVMANNVIMPNCIQIGLVTTNYNSNSTVTGTFANVTVSQAMARPVSPWDEALSVEDKDPTIFIYPNPTSNGELFINLSGYQQEPIEIITLDPLGRIVGSKQINAVQDDLEVMSLRDYAPGVYYLKFIGNDGLIEVQKVIYSGN